MRNLKKHLLIAASTLAILTAGAVFGNQSYAADESRDYHISLIYADKNGPHHRPTPAEVHHRRMMNAPCPPECRPPRPPKHHHHKHHDHFDRRDFNDDDKDYSY